MKKSILCAALILLLIVLLAGCSKRAGYTGTYGMVKLPTGEVVMGEVNSVGRPSYGSVSVVIGNKEYRTSEVNVIIIRDVD